MLKNLFLLSGFSTFVVIVLVGFSVYHSSITSIVPAITQIHVIPIPATFDSKTIEELKKRTPVIVSLKEKSGIVSEDTKKASESAAPAIKTPVPTILP
jgi:hypothetical protein